MSKTKSTFVGDRTRSITKERGGTRIVVLGLVCLAAGFGGGVFWHYRATRAPAVEAGTPAITLSESTQAILRRLDAPVEIRFYALLGQEGGDAALRAFAARAEQLLAEFERVADGKLEVKRHTTSSNDAMTAAATDGITAFNRERGETYYLGAAIVRNDEKETLRQLLPEWEPALESDLSRAIERVTITRTAALASLPPSTNDLAATEIVQRTLPDLASLSVEEGTRVLREAALKEFEAAVAEGEALLQTAQERAAQAQSSQTEAERQAAREQFLQLQAAHTARLKSIALRLEAQTRALERLKGVPPATPKKRTAGAKTMH